jgi:hypothetical protein
VVVLALLGGYIWYTFLREGAPPVAPTTPEPTEILFFTVAQDKVQAIQVTDVKNSKITRVVRDGENWKMEQPASGEAYFTRVDDLVFALTRISAERKLAPQTDLTPFGLNPPQYALELTLDDASKISILLGNENPEGNAYYALKNGDSALYLVDSSIGDNIKKFVNEPPYTPTPSPTPNATAPPQATPTP